MPITAQVGGILPNFMKFEEIPDFNQTRAVADQRSSFIGPRQSFRRMFYYFWRVFSLHISLCYFLRGTTFLWAAKTVNVFMYMVDKNEVVNIGMETCELSDIVKLGELWS